MKRLQIVLLIPLFAAGLLLGTATATEEPVSQEEVAAEVVPAEEAATKASCDSAVDLPTFLTTPIEELAFIDVSPLDCDCNSNADCRGICGDEGGTCFIGPVCDNWPDFTGKCMCAKQELPRI